MKRRLRRAWWLAIGFVLASPPVEAARVVGLRDSYSNVFVAVRGQLAAGTVIHGIRFYSNDAMVYPEVFLASDEATTRLPKIGRVLRSVLRVAGGPGYVTVEFPPLEMAESQYLWAVVRFPDQSPMHAVGLGGGAAIGWREERVLPGERSLFSVEGALNEFSPGFDITLVTAGVAPKATEEDPAPMHVERPTAFGVKTWADAGSGGVVLRLEVPRPGHLTVDVYSVAGRRIRRLADGGVASGSRDIKWNGQDEAGAAVANGIYVFKVRLDGEQRMGKVLLVR